MQTEQLAYFSRLIFIFRYLFYIPIDQIIQYPPLFTSVYISIKMMNVKCKIINLVESNCIVEADINWVSVRPQLPYYNNFYHILVASYSGDQTKCSSKWLSYRLLTIDLGIIIFGLCMSATHYIMLRDYYVKMSENLD